MIFELYNFSHLVSDDRVWIFHNEIRLVEALNSTNLISYPPQWCNAVYGLRNTLYDHLNGNVYSFLIQMSPLQPSQSPFFLSGKNITNFFSTSAEPSWRLYFSQLQSVSGLHSGYES